MRALSSCPLCGLPPGALQHAAGQNDVLPVTYLAELHDLCLVHAGDELAFLVIVEEDRAGWRL